MLLNLARTLAAVVYTGATQLLKTPSTINTITSILAVTARQSSFVDSSVFGGNPWSTPFEVNIQSEYFFNLSHQFFFQTSLSLSQGFSAAKGLVSSCPTFPPNLKSFSLLVTSPKAQSNQTITLTFSPDIPASQYFAAFINGVKTQYVPITANNGSFEATVPEVLGTTWLVITTSPTSTDDDFIAAGPAYILNPFAPDGSPTNPPF